MGKRHVRVRVAVLVRQGDTMLMIRHTKGDRTYWVVPGGGLDYGETVEDCGRRELLEETNLDVEVGRLLFVSESIPPDRHRHVVNLYVEGRLRGGKLALGEEPNLSEVRFVPFEELPSLTIYPALTDEMLRAVRGEPVPLLLGNRWDG